MSAGRARLGLLPLLLGLGGGTRSPPLRWRRPRCYQLAIALLFCRLLIVT